MKTPYQILNVVVEATDAEIKQAYLLQVKDNPPDRNQQKFQLIHDAYVAIKDIKSRVSHDLFNLPIADFDEVIDNMLTTEHKEVLTPRDFNRLLSMSVDNSTIENSIPAIEK